MIQRFGRFSIDPNRLELTEDGEPVTVEPQVFSLLAFLIENRDRVLSKDEIIEHVWQGRIVSDDTLNSRISAARRAVGDNGTDQAVIKTFPRRGFRFVAEVGGQAGKAESAGVPNLDNALPLPDKPSIAVLPFHNMSGDPEQEYFVDGIAEDIITALSRYQWFFVIARNSSFSYKGTSPDIRRVAQELGVQYVLEGSVRKGGNRVRISAQLIEAATGRHVWAEKYDRELADVFAVQDEITEAISGAVAPEFIAAEARRVERKRPGNFDSWDYAVRGNWHQWSWNEIDLSEACRLYGTAIELDPKNSVALSGFAVALAMRLLLLWVDDPARAREEAKEYAQRAVAVDPHDAWAHAVFGFVATLLRQHETAVRECNRALELNPNLALAEGVLAVTFGHNGDSQNAIAHHERATRLSPRDPAAAWWNLARIWAAFIEGEYEESLRWTRRLTDSIPGFPTGWRFLATNYAHLGRLEDAKAAIKQLLQLLPHDTVEFVRLNSPGRNKEVFERYLSGLQVAGLPEK